MSAKTKIIVLRMKELIYSAIFIGLVLVLILLFVFMFRPQKQEVSPSSDAAATAASYHPGLYSASVVLGSQHVNVDVTVDAEKITSISLVPLSESVAAMYPLMQPAMETLASQILEKQALEGIEYPSGSQYTSMALMNAIETALSKAKISSEPKV